MKNIRSDLHLDKVSDEVKEDWTSFQHASQLIQVCGKFISHRPLEASACMHV